MQKIKLRWRMWNTYTNKGDKIGHALLLVVVLAVIAWIFTDSILLGVISLLAWANIYYAFVMKDVWHNAYHQTETLRALGWNMTKALNQWTFVKFTKVDDVYYIDPDNPAADPDETDDAMFTHEIVIRLGMDSEGEEITSYRIPEDMGLSSVVGALESVKLQYTYDSVGEDDE